MGKWLYALGIEGKVIEIWNLQANTTSASSHQTQIDVNDMLTYILQLLNKLRVFICDMFLNE